jgi:DNA repair protein SbcD/Mre11
MDRGWNLRERDVAGAFRRALQDVARLKPDLVLITGDIFERPDPPSAAYVTLHRGLNALRSQLPRTPVLVIAGERDTPRNPSDPGPLAVLESSPGVEVASGVPRSVRFRDLGVHALLVPHRAILDPPLPKLQPDREFAWNILLVRGRIGTSSNAVRITPSDWDYVAVGGPHRAADWHPHVRAAGSIERPERLPWRDAAKERGFLSFNLETGDAEFHPVTGRPIVDLAPVRVRADDLEAGTRRLRELLEGTPGGIAGKLVRVPLRGDVLNPAEGVSGGLLMAIASQAAHVEFHLAEEGAEEPDRQAGAGWRPEVLRVGRAPGESDSEFPLAPGLTILSADSEEDRRALRRDLEAVVRVERSHGGLELHPQPAASGGGSTGALPWGDAAAFLEGARDHLAPGAAGKRVAGVPPGEEGKPDAADVELLEMKLRDLRADSVEATGDLEARTLDWIRERQDADSKLQAYRDRARELRERIRVLDEEGQDALCPTCGRVMGATAPGLAQTLRDEWEALVQDGRWWSRRREQLEEKPEELRRMESGVVRAQAGVASAAESLERLRERRRVVGERKLPEDEGRRLPGGPEDTGPGTSFDESDPGVRSLLRIAANLAGSLTNGRIAGIRIRGGAVVLQDSGLPGREWEPKGEDLAVLLLALRLGLEVIRGTTGHRSSGRSFFLWEFATQGEEELIVSAAELSVATLPEGTSVIAITPPAVVQRIPERLAGAFAFRKTARGSWSVREVPVGTAGLNLEESS